MPRLTNALPSYRKHRASGQAVVTLSGADHYLGKHGTKSSRTLYDRLVAEWLVNGRSSPAKADGRLEHQPEDALSLDREVRRLP
ncbi:hypothetical protein MalM25_07750 [Planctomycetes bacterium MalM25]|nr:hypothetical protein MalM25_07750 [Planctomycetes bacterium MalM25]